MPESWNEIEIRSTIKEYFKLLNLEQSGKSFVKNEAYRRLYKLNPRRSLKSFEYKFQNISAVLYEFKLPYLSGLKPKFNYQRLMRLLVLDEIDKTKLPNKEPWEILSDRLKDIKRKEPILVKGKGTGRFGLAIEKELGIEQNSDKKADFMGIELKTKHGSTLQTLFSRIPTEYVNVNDKKEFFSRFNYYDKKRKRKALYTSLSSNGDSLGFSLNTTPSNIVILHNKKCFLRYDKREIELALLSKHSQTFFIAVNSEKTGDKEYLNLEKVFYCKWPSILNFVDLVDEGKINLDFTLSEKDGKIRDHGFLWRIQQEFIEALYLSQEEVQLK